MVKLRAFIIDDEPPARARLRALLADESTVEVVGESDGSPDCLRLLREQRPNLIFLDLHLPQEDGFSLLQKAELAPLPAVVVVTAYAEHAIEGYDHQVTDYLLKPCRVERLRTSLERARSQIAAQPAPVNATRPAVVPVPLIRFVVRNEQHLDVVPATDVDWLGAAGNYVVIHAGRDTHVLRESLTSIEQRLDAGQFVRVSRSALVNLNRIKSVVTPADGSAGVVLRDGTVLPLTRGTRELQARLEQG